jgi:CubicO group peptidase (beta-lactamase class C family)
MYRRLTVVLLGLLLGYVLAGCGGNDTTTGVGDRTTMSGDVAGVQTMCEGAPPLNWQVRKELRRTMQDFIGTHGGGVLFGVMLENRLLPRILVEGDIERTNSLRLASLSKVFFSFIALREGLDLDATIDTWFPADHYDRSNEITIRMLMSHKSGVQDYVPLVPFDQERTPQELVDAAYLDKPLDFAPNTSWCYSNTNYILVGLILEAVTGQSCESLLQTHFGIVAPSLYVDDGRENDFPAGYFDPWPIHWSLPWTAGALIGEAGDVLRGFRYISRQPEFDTMQQWADRPDRCETEIVFGEEYGLGLEELVFDSIDNGIGHSGDIIARSFLLKINDTIYFIHTTSPVLNQDLNDIGESLISIVENQ